MAKSIYSAGQTSLQKLLREVRAEAGLTQTELAKKLRRPQSFVAKYEGGERRLDLVELRQICQTLGLSLTDFIKRFEKSFTD